MRLMLVVFVWLAIFSPVASAAAGFQNGPVQQGAATDSAATSAPIGIIDRATVWVLTQQRDFHRLLVGKLRDLSKDRGNWALMWPLIAASFLYGVFHAAGPGHGKAVVSGYLLSHRQTLRRGIVIATVAAFVQGFVAIFIVYGLVKLAGLVPRDAQGAVLWSERASFALVIALGAYLMVRALSSILRRHHASRVAVGGGHAHGHDDADCGHAHMPTPADIERATDLKTAIAVILSIGARPCTGAVFLLIFANVASMHGAGVAATMAMSAGTALSVSTLAAFAVTMRAQLARLSWFSAARAAVVSDLVAVTGGFVIVALGISLLSAAVSYSHPIIGN